MIKTSQLCKTFKEGKGRRQIKIEALKNITLEAKDGEVTAILGPNGAGKTTLLRIIVGLDHPDSGELVIDNQPLSIARKSLGYLSDGCGLYQRLTAFENISYFAKLYGVSDKETKTRVEALSHYLNLNDLLYRRVDGFSKGQLMRVSIARSLIHNPQTIILDEPTNGLDIMTVRSLRTYLKFLASPEGGGKSVIISSHLMHEVEKVADMIVMIAKGEVITAGTVAEICNNTEQYDLEEAFVRLALNEAD